VRGYAPGGTPRQRLNAWLNVEVSVQPTFDVCPTYPVELEATLTLRPKHGLHVIAHPREGPADVRSTDR